MKRLLWLISLLCVLNGCATPLVIDNGVQTRVFTPCTNNEFCFRDTYNITWDRMCQYDHGFPVSYRSKQSEYESNKVEYILLPKSNVADQEQFGGAR